MTIAYWQAKIWGILHDPILKALHNNNGRGENSFWQELEVMSEWAQKKWNPEDNSKKILKHIKLADLITSASDRSAIGSLSTSVNYGEEGLEISHLLSGEKLTLKLPQEEHSKLRKEKKKYLQAKEEELRQKFPPNPRSNVSDLAEIKRTFWWLWRCLPEATNQLFDDETLLLMPAETRLPDCSIWSHLSLTAAMAGALAGYDLTSEDIEKNWEKNKTLSRPCLASFTFSPIQELIKASRKMRDFWAGSWLLHYLSAKVSYKLAEQYGPDCLLYPNLYQQPLIDHWLLQKYPEFKDWIDKPSERTLLTAGFPNVIVIILPKDKVAAAMQTAKCELSKAWQELGNEVLEELQEVRHWMKQVSAKSPTWEGWLESQWQTYWSAVPIGKEEKDLTSSELYKDNQTDDKSWISAQNRAYDIAHDKEKALFLEKELTFLQEAAKVRWENQGRHPFNANVGSWWASIFDQTRLAVATVKNARTWEIPTAFGPRSTISGLGPVVHPPIINPHNNSKQDWATEGDTKKYWKRQAGLFDGIEELNATETLKRGLHKILPRLLGVTEGTISASYPDLTVGIAGYLNSGNLTRLEDFHKVCEAIEQKLLDDQQPIPDATIQAWGIPLIDEHTNPQYREYHPRLLNAGWLVEELDIKTEDVPTYRGELQKLIDTHYPKNNPTDWYVIAAGDGDGMSDWLKGTKLQNYADYIPEQLKANTELQETFNEFLKLTKRMGPSTHNALSRALLDFSNQLLPYLTETRYAGRLIYGGGDDVLAYTNLWEWDNWLWDIRQCFRGDKDPKKEFDNRGDYWKWQGENQPENLAKRPLFTMESKATISFGTKRPLFTMGSKATISFGIIIAHHSVPLAIALENLWETEGKAKKHKSLNGSEKDALQVRVIYGNGNTLKATTKFDVFYQWQQLLNFDPALESRSPPTPLNNGGGSIFEQAAMIWNQHPIPYIEAIEPWVIAFCSRREQLKEDTQKEFQNVLIEFLKSLWTATEPDKLNQEVQNWFKLAAFVIRTRKIDIKGEL